MRWARSSYNAVFGTLVRGDLIWDSCQ